MAKLNKLFLIGNLTRDPDLKYTPSGSAIVSFGIAINEKWKNSNGEYQEKTHFVECSMFGKRAETVNEYFKKGSPIFVEGSLDYQSWNTKEGDKRSMLKVKVFDFQFIGSKMGTQEPSGEKPSEAPADKPYSNAKDGDLDIDQDEIPF